MNLKTNGITNLSDLGLLKVEGARAKELLQGQLTCDLNDISPTQTRLGAHCNPQGRIISLFRLFYFNQSYYLQMPIDTIPFAENALKKYAAFFKVQLKNVSDQFIQMGYCGDTLKKYVEILPDTIDQMVLSNDMLITKIPGGIPRFILIGEVPAPPYFEKCPHVSPDAWKYLNIRASLSQIYPETIEKFLPHEINLPQLDGVSFEKGCYTGQEIIARMQYRGKLKTKLVCASIISDFKPKIGQDIYNECSVAGSIVDYCDKGDNQYDILAVTNPNDTIYLDPLKKYRIHFIGNNINV